MVRLKAARPARGMRVFYTISIPYGAIKSVFRMIAEMAGGHFNSIWCD